jgi:HK97 gp10 family phage protein
MSDISIDMSEVVALATELAAAGPMVAKKADLATRQTRERMGDEAQANAPVLTGALRASREDFDDGDEHGVAFTARYAAYVEFGTSDTRPQPFMWPAADRAERTLVDEVDKVADPFT